MPYKIFPFTPGILWGIKKEKFLSLKVPESLLLSVLKDKDFIVSCHGGLVESFFSLIHLEILNLYFPQSDLYWNGDEKYLDLIKMNGLAKEFSDLTPEILKKYPTPIIFDKNNKVIFNSLFNCRRVYSIFNIKEHKDYRSLLLQIVEKSLFKWRADYTPKLRNLNLPIELKNWMNYNKFYLNKPFAMIIPENTGYSKNSSIALDWTVTEIKSFASMLKTKGISVLVFSEDSSKYKDSNIFVLSPKLEYIFYFITKAKLILSKEVDYLLIANLISKAIIFGLSQKADLKLTKNNRFLEKKNRVYSKKILTPLKVFNVIFWKE